MSYESVARLGRDLVVRHAGPNREDLTDEQLAMIEQIEAAGLRVVEPEKVNHAAVVWELIKSLDEEMATTRWFYVDLKGDPLSREIRFIENGESFRARNFGGDLQSLVDLLFEAEYELSGTIYISGEQQGDVTRHRVVNGRVTSEKAILQFSDGEIYDRG